MAVPPGDKIGEAARGPFHNAGHKVIECGFQCKQSVCSVAQKFPLCPFLPIFTKIIR